MATATATSFHGIATGLALATPGFGFARPGFTTGASLAVGAAAPGSVAGEITSIDDAVFVLGPLIGILPYRAWRPLPCLVGGAAMAGLLACGR